MASFTGTTSEKITAVEEAIDKVLNSQNYSVGGRSAARAQLSQLMELRKELIVQLSRESGTAPLFSLAQIDKSV